MSDESPEASDAPRGGDLGNMPDEPYNAIFGAIAHEDSVDAGADLEATNAEGYTAEGRIPGNARELLAYLRARRERSS